MLKASPDRFECYDTQVVMRSAGWAATWCLLTIGITGAVRHGRINGELARFGRARGRMPFAFITSAPPRSVLAWVVGMLAWLLVVAIALTYTGSVIDGSHAVAADDLTSAAGLALLLVPLWLTSLHTAHRITTASHLVGIVPDPRLPPQGRHCHGAVSTCRHLDAAACDQSRLGDLATCMIDFNAIGTRVASRPLWVMGLWLLLVGPFYRIAWIWRANTDLRTFGREREGIDATRAISSAPGASAFWMSVALPGWLLLLYAALPWGPSFAPDAYGGVDLTTGEHVWLTLLGLALLVPAGLTILRTRDRIRAARALAGLAPDTRWTGWLFPAALAFELTAVPAWTFAAQHSLNDLWSRYPPLLDEDLHGTFAPPDLRAAAIARRPELHEQRLRRIADELERPSTRPFVTLGFAALCTAVFLWQVTQHGLFPNESDIRDVGAFSSNLDGSWWRFWTANLLHGGVDHLVGNMSLWLLVGTMVERVVGHLRLLALIVVGAAGTSIGMIVSGPHELSLGASGVVFASFGLAVLLDPRARRSVGRFGWALAGFGIGLSTFTPGIASGGHVGGLLAGAVVGLVVRLAWRPRAGETGVLLPSAPLDRSAPLAPERELSIEERVRHLTARRDAGDMSVAEYDRLRHALLTHG